MNQVQNSVYLIGNLGQDPSLYDNNGNKFVTIRLATNEVYKNNRGEKVTKTHWHKCVAYGKLAETLHGLLKKGRKVAVQGRLSYTQYTDKNGVERSGTDIIINDFMILDRPAQVEPQAAVEAAAD